MSGNCPPRSSCTDQISHSISMQHPQTQVIAQIDHVISSLNEIKTQLCKHIPLEKHQAISGCEPSKSLASPDGVVEPISRPISLILGQNRHDLTQTCIARVKSHSKADVSILCYNQDTAEAYLRAGFTQVDHMTDDAELLALISCNKQNIVLDACLMGDEILSKALARTNSNNIIACEKWSKCFPRSCCRVHTRNDLVTRTTLQYEKLRDDSRVLYTQYFSGRNKD